MVVQSYAGRTEADLAKGALEEAGIQAMIQADTAAAHSGHVEKSRGLLPDALRLVTVKLE